MVPLAKLERRADIEGLRAVAVLPILIFHLEPSLMPGGFIGVDIFFVISGFLISGQILKSSAGGFSFATFYLRRFRRLFPALAVVAALSLAASWRILPPADFKALAWSAIASLAGIANVHFYASVDYFNENALLHPLLHVWSLSVEEQFYLIWPVFLLLLFPFGKKTQVAIMAIAGLASLVASAMTTSRAPQLAFYMMPFRIFEFAAGALVFRCNVRPSNSIALLCGFAGLFMLAICLIVFDTATPWPGTLALVPTIATGLLLIAGQSGVWRDVLSIAPLRVIGRISYSVYLVHWPLIVLYRAWAVVPPSRIELGALFGLSIVFGGLIYVFVERLYRLSPEPKIAWLFIGPAFVRSAGAALEKQIARRQASIFTVLILFPALIGGFCATAILHDGFPERMKRGRVQQVAGELSFAGDVCSSSSNRCAFGDASSSHVVYLVGDSYALNLIYGLDKVFRDSKIRGVAFYDHGCLFLKDTMRFISGVADRQCEKNIAFAFSQIMRDRHPVIFAGNYGGYVKNIGEASAAVPFKGTGSDYFAWIEEYFRNSLRAIDADGRSVVVLADSYSTGIDTAKCAAQFGWDDKKCLPASLHDAMQNSNAADTMLSALRTEFPRITIVDSKTAFCTQQHCTVQGKGLPYFRDVAHLTNEGSAYLAEQVGSQILAATETTPNR